MGPWKNSNGSFHIFVLYCQNRLFGYCHYLANCHISFIKCFSSKPCCLDIRCWNKLSLCWCHRHPNPQLDFPPADMMSRWHPTHPSSVPPTNSLPHFRNITSDPQSQCLDLNILSAVRLPSAELTNTQRSPLTAESLSPCISLRRVTMHRLTHFSEGPRKASALF